MNPRGLIISGTKGRYGKSRIVIDVYYHGVLGREYIAFAKTRNDTIVEMCRTPKNAINKAKNSALQKQEFIIEQRKLKTKRT